MFCKIRSRKGLRFKLVDIRRRWLLFCWFVVLITSYVIRIILNTINASFLSETWTTTLIMIIVSIVYWLVIRYSGIKHSYDRASIDRLEKKWSDSWYKYTKHERQYVEYRAGRKMVEEEIAGYIDTGKEPRIIRASKFYYVFLKRDR